MRSTGGGASAPVRGLAVLAAVLLGLAVSTLPAAADQSRPTVDPSAPTPTAPYPGGPPQGHAPDGRTIGGGGLGTPGGVGAAGAPPPPDGLAAAGWLGGDAGPRQGLAAPGPPRRPHPPRPPQTPPPP